jgi:hypothetical protein
MCYSAKIQANYREYVRRYGADMDIETFRRLFFARAASADIKIPKAVDAAFSGVDEAISAAIAAYRSQRTRELETEMFEQRARLAAAEKKLAVKITKKASEDVGSPRTRSMRQRAGSTIFAGRTCRSVIRGSSWLVCTRADRGRRQTHGRADAVSMPYTGLDRGGREAKERKL